MHAHSFCARLRQDASALLCFALQMPICTSALFAAEEALDIGQLQLDIGRSAVIALP